MTAFETADTVTTVSINRTAFEELKGAHNSLLGYFRAQANRLAVAPSCPQAVPQQTVESQSFLTSLLSKRSALGESS